MSRIKTDLSYVTLNQLCTLTGKTYRTLKKLLEDVPTYESEEGEDVLLYSPQEALPAIYKPEPVEGSPGMPNGMLNPIHEKARLDKLRADKVELELGVLRGRLVPVEQVEEQWLSMAGNFRMRILSISSKLALRLLNKSDPNEVQRILETEHHEALKELSQHDPGSESDSRSSSQSH